MTTQDQTPSRSIQYIDLSVAGMTCDDCVRTVTNALEAVPGVSSAAVSLAQRSARVETAQSVEPERLTASVRAAGYNAFVRSPRTAA